MNNPVNSGISDAARISNLEHFKNLPANQSGSSSLDKFFLDGIGDNFNEIIDKLAGEKWNLNVLAQCTNLQSASLLDKITPSTNVHTGATGLASNKSAAPEEGAFMEGFNKNKSGGMSM